MAKTTIAVTVDSDVIESIRSMNINISKEVNSFFKSWLVAEDNNTDGLDYRLTEIQLEKNRKKMLHYQAAVKSCEAKLGAFRERQKEAEEKKLKVEKEAIKAMYRCISCGITITEGGKKHKFNNGMVCHSCYMTAKSNKIREWSG